MSAAVDELRATLAAAADDERVPQMAAYTKDHFEYFGIGATDRRSLTKNFVRSFDDQGPNPVLRTAAELWALPERELQYVAADLLRRRARVLTAEHLGAVEQLIVSKSWWDTVDVLAPHVVGAMARTSPPVVTALDRWIDDDNIWRARTSILHQLMYKADTDADRLFTYAEHRAADTEFFIRKAIGWALRQYARQDPDAVRRFVDTHRSQLSGLTIRQATKHL